MGQFLNLILFRDFRLNRMMKKWIESMESELAEGFLENLLRVMSLVFLINLKDFRRNIEGFKGRYLFRSGDNQITVTAVFENNKMKVYERSIDDANVTVNFKNGRALLNYILSPKPDILGSILRQDVSPDGNLNYLCKFAYMAKRLQLIATGKV